MDQDKVKYLADKTEKAKQNIDNVSVIIPHVVERSKDRDFLITQLSKLSQEKQFQIETDILSDVLQKHNEVLQSDIAKVLSQSLQDNLKQVNFENIDLFKKQIDFMQQQLNELRELKKLNKKEYDTLKQSIDVTQKFFDKLDLDTIKQEQIKKAGALSPVTYQFGREFRQQRKSGATLTKSIFSGLKSAGKEALGIEKGEGIKQNLGQLAKGGLGLLLHGAGILTEDPILNIFGSKVLEKRKAEIEKKREFYRNMESAQSQMTEKISETLIQKELDKHFKPSKSNKTNLMRVSRILDKPQINEIYKPLGEQSKQIEKLVEIEKQKFEFEKDIEIDKQLKQQKESKTTEKIFKPFSRQQIKQQSEKSVGESGSGGILNFLKKNKKFVSLLTAKNLITKGLPLISLGATVFGGIKAFGEDSDEYGKMKEKEGMTVNDVINPAQYGRNIVHATKLAVSSFNLYKTNKQLEEKHKQLKVRNLDKVKSKMVSKDVFNTYKQRIENSSYPILEVLKMKNEGLIVSNPVEKQPRFVLPDEVTKKFEEKSSNIENVKTQINETFNQTQTAKVIEKQNEIKTNQQNQPQQQTTVIQTQGGSGTSIGKFTDNINISSEPDNLISILYKTWGGV